MHLDESSLSFGYLGGRDRIRKFVEETKIQAGLGVDKADKRNLQDEEIRSCYQPSISKQKKTEKKN